MEGKRGILLKSKKVSIRKIGNQLSQMMMPHLSIFIAWGVINVIAGLGLNELQAFLSVIEHALLSYLLPLLIGYTGGKQVEETRGGTIAAIATIGMIVGTSSPQIIGAMVVGPLSVWSYLFIQKRWAKISGEGYEMVLSNFLAGCIGGIWCLFALFLLSPVINQLMEMAALLVAWFIQLKLLPLVSLIIEPAKVFFFNNTINHGVLTPIGLTMAEKTGQSILFLVETNPGPGLGILLAYSVYQKKKAQTAGAALIQLFGGIHEVYFPYVLMESKLFVALIVSGMSGTAIFDWFNVGLKTPVSPGSILLISGSTPWNQWFGMLLGVMVSTLVSFFMAKRILKQSEMKKVERKMVEADAKLQATQLIRRIIVACDAGIGSSAMGASLLRKAFKEEGFSYFVDYQSVYTLEDQADTLVLVHPQLKDTVALRAPNSQIMTIDNFLDLETMQKNLKIKLGMTETVTEQSEDEQKKSTTVSTVVLLYADNIRGSQTMAIEMMRHIADQRQVTLDFEKQAVEKSVFSKEIWYIMTPELFERYPEVRRLEKILLVADLLKPIEFEAWLEKEVV